MIHITGGRPPPEPRSTVNDLELNHWAIPPINKLPSEVLAEIMGIVASSALCWGNRWSKDKPFMGLPEILAHVCSHWRQVAIHSRSLWSHIDLTTQEVPNSRAITFLNRAGQSPLNLHIVGHRYDRNIVNLIPFLTPIAPQLKSLGLSIHSVHLSHAEPSILHTFFLSCTPGNLTELSIQFADGDCLDAPLFIGARGDSNESTDSALNGQGEWLYIDVPQERFEDILRSITILRLDLIYPPWTSRAYHGLVELRLLGGTIDATIAESQLVNLLRHSPRLRVFHFGLVIVNLVSLDAAISNPVILQDLEVLNLNWMQYDGIEVFLRWLAPSPKLFQFSHSPYDEEGFKHPAIVAFFASSNITMIHGVQISPTGIVDLVGLCNHIRVLALDDGTLYDTGETLPFKLHTLYLLWCSMEVNHLRRWVQSSSIQRLILYQFNLNQDGIESDLNQLPALLSDICPEISIVVVPDESPSPIEGWEISWGIDC